MKRDYWKVPEFASHFSVADKTAWAWVAAGRVGVVRLGRSVRIPQREVDRLAEEGFTPARTA
jgi:excisionase family DNA binding protein